MKKFIYIALFSIAATSVTFAQQSKVSTQTSTTTNPVEYTEMSKIITLDAYQEETLKTLMVLRNQEVAKATSTDDKKAAYETFGLKYLGCLTPEQLTTLKANKQFYNKFTVYSSK